MQPHGLHTVRNMPNVRTRDTTVEFFSKSIHARCTGASVKMALMDDIDFEDDPVPNTPLHSLTNSDIVRRSPVGEDDSRFSGLNLLASVARTPGSRTFHFILLLITVTGTRRLVRAGTQMNTRSPGLFRSPSVLRRRQREPEIPSWSKNQKLHFSEFATHVCVEYDVPTAEKDDIIAKSQVKKMRSISFDQWSAHRLSALHARIVDHTLREIGSRSSSSFRYLRTDMAKVSPV
jgi:hypothetical protein